MASSAPHFAVIGHPVHHSLSPALFGWLFRRLGLSGSYVAKEVLPEDLQTFVAEMQGGAWAGASITLPHKEAVRAYLESEDPLAAEIGAVNTLVPGAAGIRGWNTDAEGFVRALGGVGTKLQGARVLLLGAGGAGRAALFASLREGAASVQIANRTLARAQALAAEGGARCRAMMLDPTELRSALASSDVLVNATRVGLLTAGASPLPPRAGLHAGLTVLDMVYRPLETALLQEARAERARTVDGLWMLVHQALAQLRLWTGRGVEASVATELHEHLSGEAT